MKKILSLSVSTALLLTACGGGGESGGSGIASTPVTVNQAPITASANADQSATVGDAFSYDATQAGASFTDADGDSLTYAVSYSPAAQGLSDTAGVISGTPSAEGTITVTITANDGNGGSVSDSFDIVVSPAGTDQNAVIAKFAGRIDLDNLENYEGQTAPNFITKLNEGGNPISDAGATLGRVLFYDTALSIDDTISCSSCHTQSMGFGDADIVSTGVEGGVTGRHSMRLINTQFADETNFFWDERADSHEAQETQPLTDPNEHGFSGENGRADFAALVTKLEALEYYEELFTFTFGDADITEDRLQLALAQFTKSIWSFDSKFDEGRAQVNNNGANFPNYTADENAGKTLFLQGPNQGGAGCQACHRAPEFDIRPGSDHNGVVGVAEDPDAFDFTNTRSPSLRDLAAPDGTPNGPFMHDGSLATLLDVVNHYDEIVAPADAAARQQFLATIDNRLRPGGNLQNLNLSDTQKDQLVAFLNTLSGSEVYTDTKWSDPF
jgi:cytochrome c peroxidase